MGMHRSKMTRQYKVHYRNTHETAEMTPASKANIGFSLALVIHIVSTVAWYATLPHLTRIGTYVSWAEVFVGGFLVAMLGATSIMQRTVVLGIVMGMCAGLIHWLAALTGIRLDAGTAEGVIVFTAISIPFYIGLTVSGGLSARILRSLVT